MTEGHESARVMRFVLPDAPTSLAVDDVVGVLADLDALHACVVLATQPGYEKMPGRRLSRDASSLVLAEADRASISRLRYGSEWQAYLASGVPWVVIAPFLAGVIQQGASAIVCLSRLPSDIRHRNAETELLLAKADAIRAGRSIEVDGEEPEEGLEGELEGEVQAELVEAPASPQVQEARREASRTRSRRLGPPPQRSLELTEGRDADPEPDDGEDLEWERGDKSAPLLLDRTRNAWLVYKGPVSIGPPWSTRLGPGMRWALDERSRQLRGRIRRLGGMRISLEID